MLLLLLLLLPTLRPGAAPPLLLLSVRAPSSPSVRTANDRCGRSNADAPPFLWLVFTVALPADNREETPPLEEREAGAWALLEVPKPPPPSPPPPLLPVDVVAPASSVELAGSAARAFSLAANSTAVARFSTASIVASGGAGTALVPWPTQPEATSRCSRRSTSSLPLTARRAASGGVAVPVMSRGRVRAESMGRGGRPLLPPPAKAEAEKVEEDEEDEEDEEEEDMPPSGEALLHERPGATAPSPPPPVVAAVSLASTLLRLVVLAALLPVGRVAIRTVEAATAVADDSVAAAADTGDSESIVAIV